MKMFRPRFTRPALLMVLALTACTCFATSAGAATPQVVPGYYHGCALEASGTVKCFGYNTYGESAGNTNDAYAAPSTIDLGGKAISVSANGYSSCAVLESGVVKCWGYNGYGVLGDGTTNDSPTPVTVNLTGAAIAVAVSYYSVCAVMQDGGVKCWGYGGYGGLGNGSTADQLIPVSADLGGHTATSITAGYSKTCVLVEGGQAMCWGDNYGQDIDDSAGSYVSTPTVLDDTGGTVTQVAGDYEHVCILLAGGTVKCRGYGGYSQLGNGTYDNSTTWVSVPLTEAATSVTVGWYHSCAQLQSGAVKCWGYNDYGQISSDTSVEYYTEPQDYDAGGTIRSVHVGAGATCVIMVSGDLNCSGYNV
ncbi:MAG: hypothetical protein QM648_01510, partial [Solirubrobacterales bacterium]